MIDSQKLLTPVVPPREMTPGGVSNGTRRASISRKTYNIHGCGVITRRVKREKTVPVSYPDFENEPGDGYVRNHNDIEREGTTVVDKLSTDVNQ